MTKKRYNLLLVIPACIWVAFLLGHALGPPGAYTIIDKKNAIGLVLYGVGVGLSLCYLVACIFKRMRWPAVASLLIVIVSAYAAGDVRPKRRAQRLAVGIQQLDAIYRDIAT